jgi:hypothetical protein
MGEKIIFLKLGALTFFCNFGAWEETEKQISL